MNRCEIERIHPQDKNEIKLHHHILDILFSHKDELLKKFSDLKGLYCLDHIAVTIFNPENEVVVFSLTPSVEYNIIIQDFWRSDITFDPDRFENGSFIWWDENQSASYGKIREIKEINHNFTVGFNLYKKTNEFKFVYSFATRSKDKNIRKHYFNFKKELFLIGDYSYKLVSDIYSKYCNNCDIPEIISHEMKFARPILHLIE